MGFEESRFPDGTSSFDPVVFCPLCHKVLDDPVQLDCVKLEVGNNKPKSKSQQSNRHIFCRTCIVEYFADSGIACPIDGEKFKRNTKRSLISPPPKKIFDILSKLELTCDFPGCSKVVQLKNLVTHTENCEFKAAPILKISISGGTYNSIASYHSHVVNNASYGNNDHNNKNNGDCSSSYGSEQSLSQRTKTPDPVPHRTGDDSFEERLRKIERKYQERLDVTKHVLEAKVDQYNQDQMTKLRQSYQKELENQQKVHQVQMAQVEEKIRKEVDGLKRHWIEDTQKPLKKQKLRRVEPSPRSISPSSPRKDQSLLDSEDNVFNRLCTKLEDIARTQKKELLHMITVEMIKTEKVLRQELKDMTEGLNKDSAKNRKSSALDTNKPRAGRGRPRLSNEEPTQSEHPAPELWKSVQQEVRTLRSEVRKLLRNGNTTTATARINPEVGSTEKPVSESKKALRSALANKLANRRKKPKQLPVRRNLRGIMKKPATAIAKEPLSETTKEMSENPETETIEKKKGLVGRKKKVGKRGRPPGRKNNPKVPQPSATDSTEQPGPSSLPDENCLFQADPALILDRVNSSNNQPLVAKQGLKRRNRADKKKRGVIQQRSMRRSTRKSSLVIPGNVKRTSSSNSKTEIKAPRRRVRKTDVASEKRLVGRKKNAEDAVVDGEKTLILVKAGPKTQAAKVKGKRGRPRKDSTALVAAKPIVEDETTLTEIPTAEKESANEETHETRENTDVDNAKNSAKSSEIKNDITDPEVRVTEKVGIAETVEEQSDPFETQDIGSSDKTKNGNDTSIEKLSMITESETPKDVDEVTNQIPPEKSVEVEKVAEVIKEKAVEVVKEKPAEVVKEKVVEVVKEKESSRYGGDDILRAAMDAIGGGAENFSEAPSMMPLPPVATIAGKQFFASFPLSIPFSLPMTIPVFGRLSSSIPKPKSPVKTTIGSFSGSTVSESTLVTSTATTSFSPEKSSDLIKAAPSVKEPTNDVVKTSGAKSVTENPESNEAHSDQNGEGSSSESTLPFRKRRAATTAGKSSSDHGATASSNFDEGNSSEFNIINHILQIEENMKPTEKVETVNGANKVAIPNDDDESDELENFASITEQVLNDLNNGNNSDEEPLPSATPAAATATNESSNNNFSKLGTGSAPFPPSVPESNVTSLTEDGSVSGPNATLVPSTSAVPFQPYLDHGTTPPRIHDMTQVPPVIFPTRSDVPYNSNPSVNDTTTLQPVPTTTSVNAINQPWY